MSESTWMTECAEFPPELLQEATAAAATVTSSKLAAAKQNGEARMKANEERLRSAGVDVDRVKKIAEQKGRELAKRFTEMKALSVSELVAKTEVGFTDALKAVYADMKNPGDLSDGVDLFLGVLVVNTVFMALASTVAGPIAGMALGASICAPVTEEGARRIAIKRGYGLSQFTALVNYYEFVSYVLNMLGAGVNIVKAVAIRLVAAVLHQILAATQILGTAKDIQREKENPGQTSFFLAVAIHAAWNATFTAIGIRSYLKQQRALGLRESAADYLAEGLDGPEASNLWETTQPTKEEAMILDEDTAGARKDPVAEAVASLVESAMTSNESYSAEDLKLMVENRITVMHEGWLGQWFSGADEDEKRKLEGLSNIIRTESQKRKALEQIDDLIDNSNRFVTYSSFTDWLAAGAVATITFGMGPIIRTIWRLAKSDDRKNFREGLLDLRAKVKAIKVKGD